MIPAILTGIRLHMKQASRNPFDLSGVIVWPILYATIASYLLDARHEPRLLLGSCPDSWGVWHADDPLQTPWNRFLDELAGVGYEWLELGPYGYLPTDPAQLSDELAARSSSSRRPHPSPQ